MLSLPTGTVTFFVSDLGDGDGALTPGDRRALLERQGELVGGAIGANGGVQFRAEGATLFGAFQQAADALAALLSTRQALATLDEQDDLSSRLRLILHTTETDVSAGRYLPSSLRHAARLLRAARGGQTLIGAAVARVISNDLPAGLSLLDLGDHLFTDLTAAERVYQLSGAAAPVDPRPIKSLDWHPHNLPPQTTPLIGRDVEQAEVEELLRRPHVRLATLTGPGGIGKTRLALHVAAALAGDYDDGAFFVPLASIADPSQIVPAIASTLDIAAPDAHDLGQALLAYLSERQLLLVIDNLEHVVDGAPHISGLLASCPRVKVLTTSREALNVQGEHVYPVPPLALPSAEEAAVIERIAGADAVRLFLTAAKKANPRFELTDESALPVAEICRLLDGLPLAIELAAASINVLSPPHLLERLEQHLPLPRSGRRDAPARHQTLRDTIAWSYDLLPANEQLLFRRLAVFAGGFALDSAERVGRQESGVGRNTIDFSPDSRLLSPVSALDGVTALVSKSLLQPQASPRADEDASRFVMLRTIHEFAREQLHASAEAEDIRLRHRDWFLTLAEQADAELLGPGQAAWLARLDADVDDLRAALRWSIDRHDAEPALRLGCALWRYWARRGLLREGQQWLERALDLGDQAPPALRARAFNDLGNLANNLDDYPRASALYEESLALRRGVHDQQGVADTLLNLGFVALHQGQFELAQRLAEESLTDFEVLHDSLGAAFCRHLSGWIAAAKGDGQRAWQTHEQEFEIQRDRRDDVGQAYARWRMGIAANLIGDIVQARDLFVKSLTAFRNAGDRLGIAYALHGLAASAADDGRIDEAISLYLEALVIWRDIGRQLGTVECLEGLAQLAVVKEQRDVAIPLLSTTASWRKALGTPLEPSRQKRIDQATALAQEMVQHPQHAESLEVASTLLPDEAVALVQSLALTIDARGKTPTTVRLDEGSQLTAREMQVLQLLAAKMSNAEIADTLAISLRTVTTHVANIFGKMGVNSRTSAAVYALRHGLA